MSQHDEIVAKIREALPGWTVRSTAWVTSIRSGMSPYRASFNVYSNGTVDFFLSVEWRRLRPSRLDDAITIARLWATLGEPR